MDLKRALISVSDKTNVEKIANFLVQQNIEIISTGGTAKILKENRINYTPIEQITGNPESFNGRMKTISFEIGSGILFKRNHPTDQAEFEELGLKQIDLIICNLYPFEEVSRNSSDLDLIIENIDIGGPTMIRAAAKNYNDVCVLTRPEQYDEFIQSFEANDIKKQTRFNWALDAFKMTAAYDQFIFNYLGKLTDDNLPIATNSETKIRYGENPHQKATIIPFNNSQGKTQLSTHNQLQGKELSYNNYIDMDAAWKCTSELHHQLKDKMITTIIKHTGPCGVAVSSDQLISLQEAWACDPVSSFGSIICINHPLELEFAKWIEDKFIEIIIAPHFSSEAIEILSKKNNLRLIETPLKELNSQEKVIRSINGALLIQDEDEMCQYEYKPVTKSKVPDQYLKVKSFGMICNKYLKSNSISLVGLKDNSLVLAGSGMGQPNRLDSLKRLAGPRAIALGFNLHELVLISDAFFPFRDSIDTANEMGIKYIIQPGGSIKDNEVIQACDEYSIAMEFTGTRHFRH